MGLIKGIIGFLRALINAPETKHWIDKYEAAKRDNNELRIQLAEAQQWIDSEPDWKDQYMKRYMALQDHVKELETKLRAVCPHLKTHNEDWPDGGGIVICNDCGMSKYVWEQGEGSWQWIEDISKARKELDEALKKLAETINKYPFIPGGKV